jgi:hypothetical protein
VFNLTTQTKKRHMNYSTYLMLVLATLQEQTRTQGKTQHTRQTLNELLAPTLRRIEELVENFTTTATDPVATHRFETQLQELLREMGRLSTRRAYNSAESDDVEQLPKHLLWDNVLFTRLNRKTPQNVWTVFGQIKLWRVGYRPTDKTPEPTLFPLPLALGLVKGASPALANWVGQCMAEAGMTQQRARKRLQQEHGVGWGVKKLREVSEAVAAQVTDVRQEVQVEQLLAWLKQAECSVGRHKPLLCVGRDGVTLGMRHKGACLNEVASTATLSVLDRRGNRLGTVYLGFTPESGQPRLSAALTKLLEEVLRRWQGDSLRLGYVSDCGDNETGYYEKTLEGMVHPVSNKALEWIRVVDYYHLSQRIWTMAEALFGECQSATSWSKKMLRWLLKDGGANRVLHSAAALRDRCQLGGSALSKFATAYAYIRDRLAHCKYAEYRRVGLPCGSGVTEAACKTVFTQRLKLSGMRWKKPGAQVILDLRVVLLSGVWDAAYQRVLNNQPQPHVWTQHDSAANLAA